MKPPLPGPLTELLDGTGTMLFVKDLDGRYVHASRAFGCALGRAPAEVAGKSDRELLPPDAAAEIDGLIRLALVSGLPVEGRFVPPLRDGGRALRLQVSPWRTDGRLAGWLGVASDESGPAGAADLRAFAARVGELAHDFNNALTTVLGLVDWHLMMGVPAGPLRDDLAKVRDAALQAEALARDLVRLGREARGAAPAVPATPEPVAEAAPIVFAGDPGVCAAVIGMLRTLDPALEVLTSADAVADRLAGGPCRTLVADVESLGPPADGLIARARQIRPDLPVVLVTEEPDGRAAAGIPLVSRIARPVRMAELRACLEHAAPAAAGRVR